MSHCFYAQCFYNDPSVCKNNPNLKFTSCTQCPTATYCSGHCRIQDWTTHKLKCSGLDKSASKHSDNKSATSAYTNNRADSTISDISSRRSLKDYEFVNIDDPKIGDLGKGAYGSVKLVKEKSTGSLFGLKIVNKKNLMQNAKPEYLKREIKIQKRLDHPHIIKLYHTFEDHENVYLVLEYAKNGSLFFYLRKKKKCNEREAFVFFFQTCIGIDYLHKKGILHRDIKPENLLLDEKGNIKLCDFGWCAEVDTESRNTFCGTLDYMAPEMLKNQQHDYTVDIWSLGVLLYELLHGYAPFGGISDRDKILKIVNFEIKFGDFLTPDAKDLMIMILKVDPKKRPDFPIILEHPWMKKYEKEFKMNMEKFIYNPDKSRARSRSPISNPPNQTNDHLSQSKSVKDLSANKQPDQIIYRENPTLRGNASKPQEERQRSNSPLVSNYKSNDLHAFEKKDPSKAENTYQPREREKNINDRQRSNSPLVSEYKSNNKVLGHNSQISAEKQNIMEINTNRQRSNSPLVSEYKSNHLNKELKLVSPVFPNESSNIKIQPKAMTEKERSKSPMVENKKNNERSRSPIFENKVNNAVQIPNSQTIEKMISMENKETKYASKNEISTKRNNEKERSASRNRQPIFGEMNKSANNSFVELDEVIHERKTSNIPQRSHSPVLHETKSVSKSFIDIPISKETKKNDLDLKKEDNKINTPKIYEKQVVKKFEEIPKTMETNNKDRQRSNSPLVNEYQNNNLITQKHVIEKMEEVKQAELRERSNIDRQRSNSPLVSEYKPNFLNSGNDFKNKKILEEKGIIQNNQNLLHNQRTEIDQRRDRSVSPMNEERSNRNKIFDDKPSVQKSEMDESIMKELQKAKEIEEKIEKMMQKDQKLFGNIVVPTRTDDRSPKFQGNSKIQFKEENNILSPKMTKGNYNKVDDNSKEKEISSPSQKNTALSTEEQKRKEYQENYEKKYNKSNDVSPLEKELKTETGVKQIKKKENNENLNKSREDFLPKLNESIIQTAEILPNFSQNDSTNELIQDLTLPSRRIIKKEELEQKMLYEGRLRKEEEIRQLNEEKKRKEEEYYRKVQKEFEDKFKVMDEQNKKMQQYYEEKNKLHEEHLKKIQMIEEEKRKMIEVENKRLQEEALRAKEENLKKEELLRKNKILEENRRNEEFNRINNAQIEEKNRKNKEIKQIPKNLEEENRTTHISKFLDGMLQDFSLDKKTDVKLLNSLYDMANKKESESSMSPMKTIEEENYQRKELIQKKETKDLSQKTNKIEEEERIKAFKKKAEVKTDEMFDPNEDSFEEEIDKYLEQFETTDKNLKSDEEDLPNFGKKKLTSKQLEGNNLIKGKQQFLEQPLEEKEKPQSKIKTEKSKENFDPKGHHHFKSSDMKFKKPEPIEIKDSDFEEENTLVNEEDLENSLRDPKKNYKVNSSLTTTNKIHSKKDDIKSVRHKKKKSSSSENSDEIETDKKKLKNKNTKIVLNEEEEKETKENTKHTRKNVSAYDPKDKNLKLFYNSFALNEESMEKKNKQHHSFDVKDKETDYRFDEKKLDEIIQSKLDKAMLDPSNASKWLQTRNKEKDLDNNFLPKKLANSNKDYDESNNKLKKKNEQLKNLMKEFESDEEDDVENKRISKFSRRSYIQENKFQNKKEEEMGFFEKLLYGIGCFKRKELNKSEEKFQEPKKKNRK